MSEQLPPDWWLREVRGALLAVILWNGRKAFMYAKYRDVNGERKPELYVARRRFFQSRQSVENVLRLTAIQDILSTTQESHVAHCAFGLAASGYVRALVSADKPVPEELWKWVPETEKEGQ